MSLPETIPGHCPYCGSTDLREVGGVPGFAVFRACYGCGAVGEVHPGSPELTLWMSPDKTREDDYDA